MKKYLLFAPVFLLFSCGGNSEGEVEEEGNEYDKKINTYCEDNNLTADRQESGLYVYIEKAGNEEKPNLDSYLTLNYEGRLLDGTVFDGTNGNAITFDFPLAQTIDGWKQGIPMFGKGGKGTLVIPPDLGYGSEDVGPIPGNSILVFDIEVIDFNDTPPPPPDYSREIVAYFESHGLDTNDAIVTETGMYILMDKEGGSEKPTIHDYVTIHYTGTLTNDHKFDGTEGVPANFMLSGLIEGWKEGIPYFGKGGKGTLILPPHLGYGPRDNGDIPGNSVLIFEIELVDFSPEPQAN